MSAIRGRWDLTVNDDYPSWVELNGADSQFVGRFGSARVVAQLDIDGNTVRWQLPKQYEGREDDLVFRGELVGDALRGTTTLDDGTEAAWVGTRAPALPATPTEWGDPINLLAEGLASWHLRSPNWEGHWRVADDVLINEKVGSDLVSNHVFADFKLIAEYKLPAGSNSGIYLRGRYEFQIIDDHGHAPGLGTSGAIYGFLTPRTNSILPAGEWNRAEITLIGRFITVILNGVTIIENAEIPGITGGALDSNEGAPGPLFLQGDHGPVAFRRLELTPAVRTN